MEKESSAFTDFNKMYISGGTSANSTIVLKKPTPNFLGIGILVVVGGLVIYNYFLKKR